MQTLILEMGRKPFEARGEGKIFKEREIKREDTNKDKDPQKKRKTDRKRIFSDKCNPHFGSHFLKT